MSALAKLKICKTKPNTPRNQTEMFFYFQNYTNYFPDNNVWSNLKNKNQTDKKRFILIFFFLPEIKYLKNNYYNSMNYICWKGIYLFLLFKLPYPIYWLFINKLMNIFHCLKSLAICLIYSLAYLFFYLIYLLGCRRRVIWSKSVGLQSSQKNIIPFSVEDIKQM